MKKKTHKMQNVEKIDKCREFEEKHAKNNESREIEDKIDSLTTHL